MQAGGGPTSTKDGQKDVSITQALLVTMSNAKYTGNCIAASFDEDVAPVRGSFAVLLRSMGSSSPNLLKC